MYKTIEAMVKERAWKRASNYIGPNHDGWIVGLSTHRDADLCSESNFDVLLERLGGESKHVQVIRNGHWGVGWVETIHVSERSEKHLEILRGALNSLEDYGLLNEDDFCEREREQLENDFDIYKSEFRSNAIKAFVAATDVPEQILEDVLKNSEAFEVILRDMHQTDMEYRGIDSAFVLERTAVKRFLDGPIDCRYANADAETLKQALLRALQ